MRNRPYQTVLAFVLREHVEHGTQLLAYTNLAAPHAAWRLPGGAMLPGEPPDEALRRILAETVGLEHLPRLAVVRRVGVQRSLSSHAAVAGERHDYLLRVAASAPERWTHRVSGRAANRGALYGYQWHAPHQLSQLEGAQLAFVRPNYVGEVFAATTGEHRLPAALTAIEEATQALGFGMASDRLTGALLAALAASKPGGRLLELGTGTGLATSWLLLGMDRTAALTSVDDDASVQAIARQQLGADDRVRLVTADGSEFLRAQTAAGARFDLIFADTWPGKYMALDLALTLLAPGALYVVDDMLPQSNWPPGHEAKVAALRQALAQRRDLAVAQLDWSTGVIVATKRASV